MQCSIFLPFILLTLLLNINQSVSLIQMSYQDNISPSLVSAHFGSPSQQIHLPIDIKAQYTWITPRRYQYKDSLTGRITSDPKELYINEDRFFGNEFEDTVNLGDTGVISLQNFSLLLISEFTSVYGNVKSALGFAFSFTDERYSLIHQLKKEGLIDHLSFAFVREESQSLTEGYFFLGGVPAEIASSPRTSCKVHDINHHWDCLMNKVRIGEEEFINYDYSYFDTSVKMIYAPTRFIEFFEKHFLEDAVNKGKCAHKSFKMTVKYDCAADYLSKLPTIAFYLDDRSYELSGKKLFFCNGNVCDLFLIENKRNNDWVLGTLFLENYHLLFDYEGQQVHFYESTQTLSSMRKVRKMTAWTVVTALIISAGIGLLVFVKKKVLKGDNWGEENRVLL